jgi:DNA-binding response OmpR family regulator
LLLHFLISHAGRVVSRAQLWEQVWGRAGSAASNTIAVHVRRLRSRLGDDPRHPSILTTVGRSGYRLYPPSEVRMS